jgi:hypothetical protein
MPDAPDRCMLIELAILCFKILLGFELLFRLQLIVVKRHAYDRGTLGAYKGTSI